MGIEAHYDEMMHIPRAVRFPIELVPPPGFDEERLETWPAVPGRLEWLHGRLLYVPPCGEVQQATVTDVVIALGSWVRGHRDFVREVLVVSAEGTRRFAGQELLPLHPDLPDLQVAAGDCFLQIAG